jgi:hypothetical protein
LLPSVLAAVAIGLFVRSAVTLIRYPFDWDPGEGLVIEAATRLWQHGLAALYPSGAVVPAPFTYGPLVPALLAVTTWGHASLGVARALGTGFALAAGGAVYLLVRKTGTRATALAFAALALAPASRTYWLALARVDAAMIACWLGAAVFLVPKTLARGSDRLGWPRALAGASLLVLAVLAKPTMVVLGAPLVLGWLLVDLGSAARVGLASLVGGGLCFAWLELSTGGGFARTLWFQTFPARIPGQSSRLLLDVLTKHGAATALTLLALAIAARRRDGSWRDGAWLLWLAGPLTIPMLAKAGAVINYQLPWALGQAALAGRLIGSGLTVQQDRRLPADAIGALPAAGVALALMLAGFPLPTRTDRRTAQSFYGFIEARRGPMLAVHPDLAYVVAREPVLLEMALFPDLYRHGLPGTRQLFDRLDRQEFHTVVENLDRWSLQAKGYTPVGGCQLGYHYGDMRVLLMVPAAEAPSTVFSPLPGSRCLAFAHR